MKIPFIRRKATLIGEVSNRDGKDTDWIPQSAINSVFDDGNPVRDFLEVPEVNAVINIKARAMSSAIINTFSKQTSEPLKNNMPLTRVLRRPNWFQARREFWRLSSIYRDLYGNEFIYMLTPVGMPNNIKGMFTLDPSKVIVKYPDKLYFAEATGEGIEYWYKHNGREVMLEAENIIHLNDNRIGQKNPLLGTSKLKALAAPIANIRAAYAKRNIILSMPIGVLTNASRDDLGTAPPLDVNEKRDALLALKRRGAYPILTNLPLNYAGMQISPTQMGLFEETKEDLTRICDALGVPYEVLASQQGTTFDNQNEGKKKLYEDSVMPDNEEKVDALNHWAGTETLSWEVRATYDHLTVFDENKRDRAAAIKMAADALIALQGAGMIEQEQIDRELKRFGI
jgi:phage portal protein BeeE